MGFVPATVAGCAAGKSHLSQFTHPHNADTVPARATETFYVTVTYTVAPYILARRGGNYHQHSDQHEHTHNQAEHTNGIQNHTPAHKTPKYGNSAGNESDYDLPFHIGALFIILALSTLACAFPVFAVRFQRLRIPPTFLFLARHFGTGVLVATAFVHLLPTAFLSLTDERLGSFFHKTYEGLAGLIAMVAVFLLVVVEMVFTRGQHCCGGAVSGPTLSEQKTPQILSGQTQVDNAAASNGMSLAQTAGSEQTPALVSRLGNSESTARVLQCFSGEEEHAQKNSESERSSTRRREPGVNEEAVSSKTSLDRFSIIRSAEMRKKALLQCLLLEMSILFHSIFIGMAISVAVGREFVVFLVAISFHRPFPSPN
jgi:solute carrier family 39 (zinc transporter), member 1/2/3